MAHAEHIRFGEVAATGIERQAAVWGEEIFEPKHILRILIRT